MIFEKSSTRTRVSFETGLFQLDGHALFLSSRDIQLERGESIKATARVLSRYVDGIMIRTFAQSDVEQLAEFASVPVINQHLRTDRLLLSLSGAGGSDDGAGAEKTLEGLKICYIGDGNNMANSLLVGGLRVGIQVSVATPDGYQPNPQALAVAVEYGNHFTLTNDRFAAARDADVIFTDVWTSMGQEAETEARQKAFTGWRVNRELIACAKPDVMLQHACPHERGNR